MNRNGKWDLDWEEDELFRLSILLIRVLILEACQIFCLKKEIHGANDHCFALCV